MKHFKQTKTHFFISTILHHFKTEKLVEMETPSLPQEPQAIKMDEMVKTVEMENRALGEKPEAIKMVEMIEMVEMEKAFPFQPFHPF